PGGGVAGVLAHRPGLAPVHPGMDSARVGKLAGCSEVELLGQILVGVELGDLDARVGKAPGVVGPDDRGHGQALACLLRVAGAALGRGHAGDDKDRGGMLSACPPASSPAAPAFSAHTCAMSCSHAETESSAWTTWRRGHWRTSSTSATA